MNNLRVNALSKSLTTLDQSDPEDCLTSWTLKQMNGKNLGVRNQEGTGSREKGVAGAHQNFSHGERLLDWSTNPGCRLRTRAMYVPVCSVRNDDLSVSARTTIRKATCRPSPWSGTTATSSGRPSSSEYQASRLTSSEYQASRLTSSEYQAPCLTSSNRRLSQQLLAVSNSFYLLKLFKVVVSKEMASLKMTPRNTRLSRRVYKADPKTPFRCLRPLASAAGLFT